MYVGMYNFAIIKIKTNYRRITFKDSIHFTEIFKRLEKVKANMLKNINQKD